VGRQSDGVEENGPGVGPGKAVASADEIVVSMGSAVAVDNRVDAEAADDRVDVMDVGGGVDTGGDTVPSLLLGVGTNVIGSDRLSLKSLSYTS
jgi:hypothetical protein